MRIDSVQLIDFVYKKAKQRQVNSCIPVISIDTEILVALLWLNHNFSYIFYSMKVKINTCKNLQPNISRSTLITINPVLLLSQYIPVLLCSNLSKTTDDQFVIFGAISVCTIINLSPIYTNSHKHPIFSIHKPNTNLT